MGRAIIAAGGWAHPGDDIVDAAQALIRPHGFQRVDVVRDGTSFVEALETPCDLLVMGACWFSMSDARYNDEQRAEFALPWSPALASSLQRTRDSGCALLALHTAVICFDDMSVWSDWLGGAWNWETSFHPPPASVGVSAATASPLPFEPFEVTDELYQGLDVHDDVVVVAESQGHPLVWLHETPMARCAVNLLGHDRRSLADPNHHDLNGSLVRWLLA